MNTLPHGTCQSLGIGNADILFTMSWFTRAGSRPLRGSIVVITGASSGIGRATALEFARRGAHVVVAARRADALESVVRECERFGVRALAVTTDVSEETAVDELARRAIERFGTFDIWVNNAGLYLAGAFADVPSEDFRRVIDVNLMGYVSGVRAAVRQFQAQGHGVVINTCSVAGVMPFPYFTAYTTAKFGVLGFGLAVRQELRGTSIEVCTVLPSSIDTPIFQNAGNYLGQTLKAMTPTYRPEEAARVIVGVAERPRRVAVVGGFGQLINWLYPLMPTLFERLTAPLLRSQHMHHAPLAPTSGNLFRASSEQPTMSGGWLYSVGLLTRKTPAPTRNS
jgi:NADP-dependent 3-hydroxy acid dehydrogenase YdfG